MCKSIHSLKALLFCLLVNIYIPGATANTGLYISLAPAMVEIDTENASTRPTLVDFRFGYKFDIHQLELSVMSSLSDDSLNQLVVDVPSVNSVFYRYLPYEDTSVKIHLILGVSQVEVESSYPFVPTSTETFDGASFGVGFQESFTSIPQLKLKLDFIRLYNGDNLNINLLSLGVSYEF